MSETITKAELIELLKDLDDNAKIKFYVMDYEYDNEDPYDCGSGEFLSIQKSPAVTYINIGIHK